MTSRPISTWRGTTIAILALVCLGACAHRNEAANDSQAAATAAPAATSFTPQADVSDAVTSSEASTAPAQSTDASGATASNEPSSPALSQADGTASDGSSGTPAAAAPAGSEPQCITLEAESYCKGWSNDTALSTQTEYVRSGETVNAWKRMITIVRYKNLGSLDQIIPTYMKLVQPDLYPPGAKPIFIKPDSPQHKEEIATRFLLTDTNGSDHEYTVAYFRADGVPPAYALLFSQHVFAGMDSPSQTLYESWINDLRAVKLQ
jgi:hypothetical protein